jgi:hypothetical protein
MGSDGCGSDAEGFVAGPGERVETSLDAADTSVRATPTPADTTVPGISADTTMQGTTVRGVVTVFVAVHIVAITLWVIPVNDSLTRVVRKTVGPYFSLVGLQQEWSLFAPDPIAANSYVDAEVVLEDGEVRTWDFPRLESLDFKERYGKARYRKFAGWLYRRNYAYAWADAARYAARQFRGAGSAVRTVKLLRHWERIPPMTAASGLTDDKKRSSVPLSRSSVPLSPTWHSIVFFVYDVPPDEIK